MDTGTFTIEVEVLIYIRKTSRLWQEDVLDFYVTIVMPESASGSAGPAAGAQWQKGKREEGAAPAGTGSGR